MTRRTAVLAGLSWAGAAWAQKESARGAADHEHDNVPPVEIMACLGGIMSCSRFVAALIESGLDKSIQRMPDVTVFAPADDGFGPAQQRLSGEALKTFLRQHIVAARWDATAGEARVLSGLGGNTLRVTVDAVNGIPFDLQGIQVANGWVHVLGRPLA